MTNAFGAWFQVLLDMSCGSGLFTRRFAASGCFKGVIAADYSVGMLDQTSGFIAQNASVDPQCGQIGCMFRERALACIVKTSDLSAACTCTGARSNRLWASLCCF